MRPPAKQTPRDVASIERDIVSAAALWAAARGEKKRDIGRLLAGLVTLRVEVIRLISHKGAAS